MIDWTNYQQLRYYCFNLYTNERSQYVNSQYEAYKMACTWIYSTLKKNHISYSYLIDPKYCIANTLSIDYGCVKIPTYNSETSMSSIKTVTFPRIVAILDNYGRIYPMHKLDCLMYNAKIKDYQLVKEYANVFRLNHASNFSYNGTEFRKGPVPNLRRYCGRSCRKMQYKHTLNALSFDDEQKMWCREYRIKIRTSTARQKWDIEPFEETDRSWKCKKIKKQYLKNKSRD